MRTAPVTQTATRSDDVAGASGSAGSGGGRGDTLGRGGTGDAGAEAAAAAMEGKDGIGGRVETLSPGIGRLMNNRSRRKGENTERLNKGLERVSKSRDILILA